MENKNNIFTLKELTYIGNHLTQDLLLCELKYTNKSKLKIIKSLTQKIKQLTLEGNYVPESKGV